MSWTLEPSGYDTTKTVRTARSDCLITIGFDQRRGAIPAFLVRLHYRIGVFPIRWTAIARFDHNEASQRGHDVYAEGLHIDIKRASGGEVKLHPPHNQLPPNGGPVISKCRDYLDTNADLLVDIYEGRRQPGGLPRWSDGGHTEYRLINPRTQPTGMSGEQSHHEPISAEELDELLAEATGTSVEELRSQADELVIGPLDEATVVDE